MRPADKIDPLIKNLKTSASSELDQRIANLIVQSQAKRPRTLITWSKSMKNTFKFAAAARVVFAAFAGWNLFDKSNSNGVVWADVLQKVQQAKGISYRTQEISWGKNDKIVIDTIVWISANYGMKVELTETTYHYKSTPTSVFNRGIEDKKKEEKICELEKETSVIISYVLPGKKQITLYPSKRKFKETNMEKDILDTILKIEDPKAWVKEFVESPHISLGRSVIDGIEVEGIESRELGLSEDVVGRIWVDVKTGYPVQIERGSAKSYDFQWNIAIDKSVFEPKIPADYTIMPDRKMSEITRDEVKELTEGLKRFAQVANRYPENLKPSILRAEAAKATREAKIEKALGPNRLRELPEEEQNTWIAKDIEPIIELGITYKRLTLDEKDPAYYGQTVSPGDANSVLLRWKASDMTYKVIMGDLSVRELSSEQLKQIEPQPDPVPANP